MGLPLMLDLQVAQWQPKGKSVVGDKLAGTLCGATSKQAVEDAIDGIPDSALSQIGGKSAVHNILANLLTPDVDLDGDDEADAISVAAHFVASRIDTED